MASRNAGRQPTQQTNKKYVTCKFQIRDPAMLSKAALKYINSLQIKKYRHQHQAFVVEGAKSVIELLSSDYAIEKIYLTEDFLHKNTQINSKNIAYELVPEKELVKAGTFATNNAALAIARMKRSE